MKKNYFSLIFLLSAMGFQSQILTYVGSSALVTVQSNTLVYNGGGLRSAATSTINNYGNIMVNAVSTDQFDIISGANFNLKLTSITDYGQLYIAGIPQNKITGKVNKEYKADYLNGATGRQQTGLPFYNYTIADLTSVFGEGNLNVTNIANTTQGRFAYNSAFWWNHAKARFDQIAYSGTAYDASGNPNATFISPMTYYILPRRKPDGSYFWSPTSETKIFSGVAASDIIESGINNVQMSLSGAYSASFGVNGSSSNLFGEKYSSYLDDPFRSRTNNGGGWDTDYAKNLYQVANPFLTNIDLRFIARNEAGNTSDGNYITNLEGIAYYADNNIGWSNGTTYGTAIVLKTSDGYFQAGDVGKNYVIKPMGEFMVKLSSATAATLNFTKTRRFKGNSRADGIDYSPTAAKGSSGNEDPGINADKIVKQVAVVMYDMDGVELDRTYYAVSPSAVTGRSPQTSLQAYVEEKKIFTKEESQSGGEDINYSDKLYINEANELGFKSKEIPLLIRYNEQPYQLKFEVYEKGERAPDGLSNGNSFYIKDADGLFTKIVDGGSIAMNGNQNLGLFYEKPEGGTLGTGNILGSQTIIAKRNADWVVRFSKDWKKASIEVYSAAGQLLNSKSNISTTEDYLIPLNSQVKGTFVVKAVSEKGEIVIKKIIN